MIVERVVADIDEIVRLVRFPGWQRTSAGEREVRKALRKTLFKYRLQQDENLFERAYGYIRQYYRHFGLLRPLPGQTRLARTASERHLEQARQAHCGVGVMPRLPQRRSGY